ncbi:hypothetical protein DXG03_004838 [Asterophora parasitica]|uniref:Sin3-associated polypeptide Sap18 n=1 Tax=Asterophora parasitica TaxID=117018 RepID=A0A9P7G2B9_9AGAR|nr:hypothetical protein DXG03_004838 [Asterophora parasitica]
MDIDTTSPAGQPIVSREKTAPFLIRTFVKIGSFHRLGLFEDSTLPTTDEQQLFTWKDATLREVLTTLRNTAPLVPEYRHPLARFSFRAVYADSTNKGRFSQKDLGMVYSRDILGEPGSLDATAPRLREDVDEVREPTEREREERTLDELRFVPGDYLLVAVLLPKSVTVPTEISIKGSAAAAPAANGWRNGANGPPGKSGDGGWGGSIAPSSGAGGGRGGGHWRGASDAPSGGRGRGGRAGGDFGRDRDRDRDRDLDRSERRAPLPRRGDSPPTRGRGGWGDRGRGGRAGGRRSPSRSDSRSRSPPPRRRRYD